MTGDWTKAFFREEIFTPGSAEAEAAAPAEAAFLWRALRLKKGSRVLDVACGTGRHARRLARRGASVLGVDATPAYLREARRAARGVPNVRYARGDMRRLPFRGAFDAAINLWTSFGYFATPAEDERVLRGIARALVPGGLFLIELADFAARWRRGRELRWETRRADGSRLIEEVSFVGGGDPRTVNEWMVLRAGRPARRARFVLRGYDRPRLFAALRRAGLEPVRTWKSLGYGSSRPVGGRLVVLSRKAPRVAGAASR